MNHHFLAAFVLAVALPASAATPPAPLASLAGQWQVEQSLWTEPGAAPVRDHGEATLEMVLDGHHLEQRLRIASQAPFQGLGHIGYDEADGHYYASWMDTNSGGLLLLHGEADVSGSTYVFRGDMAQAGKPGLRIGVREVLHVTDRDHFTIEYYETRDGREARMVALDYRRK